MTNLLEAKPKSRRRRRGVNSRGIVAHPYLTYEQFLDWMDEDTHAEWVDGRVEMTSPASFKHQNIGGFLYSVMHAYAEFKDLGITIPPFQMKISKGREPDLVFLSKANQARLKESFIDGPADLVVEIVSPESRKRDRLTKFDEYQAAKIPEYWYINPLRNQAKFYQLDQLGHYQQQPIVEGKYYSKILAGFWLRPDWLWQTTLPAVQTVMLQIGGQDYARHLLDQIQNEGFM